MRTEVFGEVREGWDCEVGEELGGVPEEGLHCVVEAAEVGVGCAGHFADALVYTRDEVEEVSGLWSQLNERRKW